jgi:hypothetical protein
MTFNKILIKNIVQDKLDELSQKTIDSAARKRTAQLRDPKFKGKEVPIYKAGTGGTSKPVVIGKRRKPGKGVIQLRLQGREESPGKPAKKPLYKYITPGATGRAARQDASHQPVYDRMAELLIERNLLRDLYKGGKGLVGGLLGTQKDRRDKSKIYKTSRFIGSAVGTPIRAVAKAGANIVGSGLSKMGDLASGFKRKLKLKSALKQRQLRKQQAYDALPMMPGLVDKNANRTGKAERKPGQETEAQRKALRASAKDVIASREKAAQVAAKKALASRKRKVKRNAQRAAQDEKSRKLVNYESTSYRDLMLSRIAEVKLAQKLPNGENINEWIWMIPWAIRAAQLGMHAYRGYKAARAVGTAFRAGKTAYNLAQGLGRGRALMQAGGAAGKSLLKSGAKHAAGSAATQAADNQLGLSKSLKGYVAKEAVKSLAPDVAKVTSGVSKSLKGVGKVSSAASMMSGDKNSKKKQQEKPEDVTDDSQDIDRAYSRERGYKPVGDDDDDQ